MNRDEYSERLVGIQNTLDTINMEEHKQEFNLKLESYGRIKEILEERNRIAKEIEGFWETVFLNSEFADILLGSAGDREDSGECEAYWIDSLRLEFRPNYKCYVAVVAKENEYFENTLLEKEFSWFEPGECKFTQMVWKGKKVMDNTLIRFFSCEDSSEDDDNMSVFQILYDLYVNAVYYQMRSEETS